MARFGKKTALGFSSEGSHRIVDLSMCAVLHPAVFALVAPLRALLGPMVGDKRAAHVKLTLADQGIDVLIEGVEAEGLQVAEALSEFAVTHRLTIWRTKALRTWVWARRWRSVGKAGG